MTWPSKPRHFEGRGASANQRPSPFESPRECRGFRRSGSDISGSYGYESDTGVPCIHVATKGNHYEDYG